MVKCRGKFSDQKNQLLSGGLFKKTGLFIFKQKTLYIHWDTMIPWFWLSSDQIKIYASSFKIKGVLHTKVRFLWLILLCQGILCGCLFFITNSAQTYENLTKQDNLYMSSSMTHWVSEWIYCYWNSKYSGWLTTLLNYFWLHWNCIKNLDMLHFTF